MLAEPHLCAGATFGLISGENVGLGPERRAGISFPETRGDDLSPCVSELRTVVM